MTTAELFDFEMFPLLTTARLVLREPAQSDAADVLIFRGDPEVQRYNSEPLRDLDAARVFIDELRSLYERREEIIWAVALGGGSPVVGLVSMFDWNRFHRRAELGYDLARSHWGRGIASEAVRAVIEFGFDRMHLHRIGVHTIADNVRSVRMVERLGFVREGTRREYSLEDDGAFHGSAIYGLLVHEYRPQ